MKRFFATALSLALAASLLAGCSSNLPKGHSPFGPQASSEGGAQQPQENPAPENPVQVPAGAELSTGLAVINSVGSSKDAGDEDGLAQADSNVVAVLVDADGRIVDCKIDGVQAKIPFSKEGKLLVGTDTMFRTKQELKEDYGMKKASGIGREWNEQADALAAYVTGKTLDEIRGIAVTEDGHAGDAELASSVTMSVGGWLETVEKAVANAKPMGAKTGRQARPRDRDEHVEIHRRGGRGRPGAGLLDVHGGDVWAGRPDYELHPRRLAEQREL